MQNMVKIVDRKLNQQIWWETDLKIFKIAYTNRKPTQYNMYACFRCDLKNLTGQT